VELAQRGRRREIVVSCRPDGWPQAGRGGKPPRDRNEEMRRRRDAWTWCACSTWRASQARSKPASAGDLRQEALLERFAMSDAGAVWMREVVDDTCACQPG